jgi:hypothetical protein
MSGLGRGQLRCLACDSFGHIAKSCPRPKYPHFDCCNFWRRHRDECPELAKAQAAHLQNLLEANPSNFLETDDTISLCSADQEPAEIFALSDEEEIESTSESSAYESSESDTDDSDQEMYAGKRRREGETKKETEGPGRPKVQKRDERKLPRKREAVKPVLNPLTEEEKQRRREVRARNREDLRESNLGIIRHLLKDSQPGIAAHKNYKHFRTDLHHFIDKIMFYPQADKKKAVCPKLKKEVKTEQDMKAPKPESMYADKSPESEEKRTSDRRPETSDQSAHTSEKFMSPDSRYLNIEIEECDKIPSQKITFPIRTEVYAEVEKVKKMKITLDSGATFSGISRDACDAAGLSAKIRSTKMNYKTSSGEIRPAEGKVRVRMKNGRLKIATTMLVMPYGCSYNILLANDIVGMLKADVLRSENLVRFYYQGEVVTTPLLHEISDEEVKEIETYFLTTAETDPDYAWVDDAAPEVELLSDSKNG